MAMTVTNEQFQNVVINQSMNQPVLVDFWAPWCGPCRMLGPILEKLETEFSGAWLLTKVNTDEEQELAGQFRISGIPHCILFKDGMPVDQFTGALPEPQIRSFLQKHIVDKNTEELKQKANEDPIGAAEAAVASGKDDDVTQLLIWKGFVVALGQDISRAKALLTAIPELGSPKSDASRRIRQSLKLNEQELPSFAAVLLQKQETDVTEILDQWLARVETEGKDSQARDHLLAGFDLLSDEAMLNEYRKKLARLIF